MFTPWSFVAVCSMCLGVQTGQVEMTPPVPLPLGGYTARKGADFQPGGEKIFARAVVLTQGSTRLAVVSFETLTIPDSLCDAVRAQLPKNVALFLVATHTHCAPDSQMLNKRMTMSIPGIANYKSKWLDWTASRIAAMVRSTLSKPVSPANGLDVTQAFLNLNRARRKGAHPEPTFTAIASQDQMLIASFAAHATIYDERRLQLCGDWPGAFSATTGAAFLPGAIGDMSPNVDGPTPEERIQELVRLAKRGLSQVAPWQATGRLRTVSIPISLPNPHPSPAFIEENHVPEELAKVMVSKFAPQTASVMAWSVGDLAVVGIPGEPTAAVGRLIEAQGREAGFRATLVVSHCNGWCGYILQPSDYRRGGYEATLAFHGESFADNVVQAAKAALRAMPR